MIPKLTRLHIKLKIRNIQFYAVLSKTQTLGGITSLLPNGKHIILWDLEDCTENECINELEFIQHKYQLGQIYILSDKENSFGAICFTSVDYMDMLRIIINTKYIDSGFVNFTAQRGKSTLRMTAKIGRNERALLCVLHSPYRRDRMNENVEVAFYDTGLVKKGVVLSIG